MQLRKGLMCQGNLQAKKGMLLSNEAGPTPRAADTASPWGAGGGFEAM